MKRTEPDIKVTFPYFIQHSFRRCQRLHKPLHDAVGAGAGANVEWTLCALRPPRTRKWFSFWPQTHVYVLFQTESWDPKCNFSGPKAPSGFKVGLCCKEQLLDFCHLQLLLIMTEWIKKSFYMKRDFFISSTSHVPWAAIVSSKLHIHSKLFFFILGIFL